MKIYLDLVILLNFFFDFILLYGTSKILKNQIKLKRLILGSGVGSLTIFLLFINMNSLTLFIIKLFISFLIILVTFGKNNLLKNIIYFYLLSIILGGFLYLFNNTISLNNSGLVFINNGKSINFILMIIVSPLIIFLYVKEHFLYKNTYGNIYDVSITINDNKIKLRGLLDTGNRLEDPYFKRPVILVSSNINISFDKYILVPYNALNTNGLIKCIKPKSVYINNKKFSNCLVGLSTSLFNINNIDCILPNKFKEDI